MYFKKNNYLIIANLYGCVERIKNAEFLKAILNEAIKKAKLKKVEECYHQFKNLEGATGIVLLATSHICLHSWPEKDNMLTIDIFSCDGKGKAKAVYTFLEKKLTPKGRLFIVDKGGRNVKDIEATGS